MSCTNSFPQHGTRVGSRTPGWRRVSSPGSTPPAPPLLRVVEMDRPPTLERLAAWLRAHPGAVAAALAGFIVLATVVLPAQSTYGSGVHALVGLLLTVPIAWRRRAP